MNDETKTPEEYAQQITTAYESHTLVAYKIDTFRAAMEQAWWEGFIAADHWWNEREEARHRVEAANRVYDLSYQEDDEDAQRAASAAVGAAGERYVTIAKTAPSNPYFL